VQYCFSQHKSDWIYTQKWLYTTGNGVKLTEMKLMNNNLAKVKRTLHKLLKSLPAVKAHCSVEVHKRHLALIAHYQRQYDLLAAAARA
jgi:hypothetical protein